jgi:hypothetical protein
MNGTDRQGPNSVMHAPGFLDPNAPDEPSYPSTGVSRRYAVRGCLLGSILAIVLWFVPVPVAVIVWVLELKGPFGDYMLSAIPFYVALPLVGAGIAAVYGHKRTGWRQR